MRNIPVNLTIDRHNNNGSARIYGRVDGERVSMNMRRDLPDTDAVVSGNWDKDRVQLTFNRDASQGYNQIRGSIGDRSMNGNLNRRMPDGDTSLRMANSSLDVDRDRRGQNVNLRSSELQGRYSRNLRDGDESGSWTVAGENVRFNIDRDIRTGDFTISGANEAGRFSLKVDMDLDNDRDLTMRGTLPEGAEMFPLLWEVLGDDKNIPDRNPLYPGSLLAMSMFMDKQQ